MWAAPTAIVLVVAVAVLLSGCSSDVPALCVWKHPFRGTVYKTTVSSFSCSRGSHDCYSVYAYARTAGNESDWCANQVVDSASTRDQADRAVDEYFVGKPVDWVREARSTKCVGRRAASDLFYTGVGLLGATMCVALVTARWWTLARAQAQDRAVASPFEAVAKAVAAPTHPTTFV